MNIKVLDHKNITTKETLTSIVLEIIKNRTLSVIVGNQIDAKVIEKLRALDSLRDIINITLGYQATRKAHINDNFEIEFEEDDCVVALIDIKKVSSLLFSRIEDFKVNDGELYTGFTSQDISESYIGNNTMILRSIFEGQKMFSETPLFIISDSFTKFIPPILKRLILDAPNLSLYLNQPLRDAKTINHGKYLNLEANLQSRNAITRNIDLISSSFDKFTNNGLFFNVTSFWNDTRIYFDFFGAKKETHRIHPVQDNITILDIIVLLYSKLLSFKRNNRN